MKSIKITLITLLLLIVSTMGLTASTQRSFNSGWEFSFDKNSWEKVNIPHTWNDKDSYVDGGYYRGTGWYKRSLNIDNEDLSKEIYLHFDGANAITNLYVNGKYVGDHKGGYTAFRFNITKYIKVGKNNIEIRVNNEYNHNYPPLEGDFTIFGGIYRDLSIIKSSKISIDMDNMASSGLFITTKVDSLSAEVAIKTEIQNRTENQESLTLKAVVIDADGEVITSEKLRIKVASDEEKPILLKLPNIKNPKLWSPDSPNLYMVKVELITKDGTVVDSRVEPLGLRWFSVDSENGFYLNGERLKLVGVNRHQDYKGFGNALPDALHLKDMKMIKEMGCNFLRIAHYPQDHLILQECDRLGILTCVEVPLNNKNNVYSDIYKANAVERQKEMVRQSFNHPSVVIWAMLNECLLQLPKLDLDNYLKLTGEFASEINSVLKSEDPDRLTMIVNSQRPDRHVEAKTGVDPDIVAWNLYHCWYGEEIFNDDLNNFISEMKIKFPGKGIMITEYGGGADPRLHSFSPRRWDYSEEYQVKIHKHFMHTILGRDDLMGGTVWNYADFASDFRQDTEPKINSKGLTGYDRVPKESYYYYQTLLRKDPVVNIGSKNWNQRVSVGENSIATQPVDIYSNCGDITLLLNDKVIGTKSPDRDNSTTFEVPFIDGENRLEARTDKGSDFATISMSVVNRKLNISKLGSLNISLGSNRYYNSRVTGELFLPEQEYSSDRSWGYVGGEAVVQNGLPAVGTALNIYETDDDPIFQSHREGIEQFIFDVEDGVYEITVLLADPKPVKARKALVYELSQEEKSKAIDQDRIFSITVNGDQFLEDIDINRDYGNRTAVTEKFKIAVTDGKGIKINFKSTVGKTVASGIKIKQLL